MSQTVSERIIEIIAEQAIMEVSEVATDATLEDLGMDSLALVETVFAIEEGFGISVPFNANDPSASEFDISSVQSIVDAVETLIAKQNG